LFTPVRTFSHRAMREKVNRHTSRCLHELFGEKFNQTVARGAFCVIDLCCLGVGLKALLCCNAMMGNVRALLRRSVWRVRVHLLSLSLHGNGADTKEISINYRKSFFLSNSMLFKSRESALARERENPEKIVNPSASWLTDSVKKGQIHKSHYKFKIDHMERATALSNHFPCRRETSSDVWFEANLISSCRPDELCGCQGDDKLNRIKKINNKWITKCKRAKGSMWHTHGDLREEGFLLSLSLSLSLEM
jgi:hypothetical protein